MPRQVQESIHATGALKITSKCICAWIASSIAIKWPETTTAKGVSSFSWAEKLLCFLRVGENFGNKIEIQDEWNTQSTIEAARENRNVPAGQLLASPAHHHICHPTKAILHVIDGLIKR